MRLTLILTAIGLTATTALTGLEAEMIADPQRHVAPVAISPALTSVDTNDEVTIVMPPGETSAVAPEVILSPVAESESTTNTGKTVRQPDTRQLAIPSADQIRYPDLSVIKPVAESVVDPVWYLDTASDGEDSNDTLASRDANAATDTAKAVLPDGNSVSKSAAAPVTLGERPAPTIATVIMSTIRPVAHDTGLESPTVASNDPVAAATQPDEPLLRELESFCERIDTKLSSVAYSECLSIGLIDSGAQSRKSTPLLYRDILPADGEPVARVLLIGGIHGDEYSSVSVVFKWLDILSEDLGEHFHWRVVPVLNPDGLLQPPRMSKRVNANGVDLNRNFPTPDWESEAHAYWVDRTRRNARRYPGPAPLSEPESAWLAEQIELFKPHAVISVHAPHGVVDFDGPRVPPRQLGPLQLRLLGTYPGSMGRYIGEHKGIPLLTVELESAFGMPERNELYDIWFDMLGWLHEKIAQPMQLAKDNDLATPAPELLRGGVDPDNDG